MIGDSAALADLDAQEAPDNAAPCGCLLDRAGDVEHWCIEHAEQCACCAGQGHVAAGWPGAAAGVREACNGCEAGDAWAASEPEGDE